MTNEKELLLQIRLTIFNIIHLVFAKPAQKMSKCEAFLVRIFPYSVQIRVNTNQKKLRIWTFFTQ